MSIEKMIAEHPDVGSDYNESLGGAVKQAMYCAAICNSCADACIAEEMDMSRCIRLCLDCSDVCEATYRVASRRTDHNRELIRTLLATCIHACEICEAECVKHDNPHCHSCAQMCRECAEGCRTALETINDEVHAEGGRSTFAHHAAGV
ncbi:MAG TPA: four-helix bundle copper-binding protein [Croceibacterium sp.]|nr:four-helix bundle copper-binding protein [Croceibacterium sp.]